MNSARVRFSAARDAERPRCDGRLHAGPQGDGDAPPPSFPDIRREKTGILAPQGSSNTKKISQVH
jgi:hypothetical protein